MEKNTNIKQIFILAAIALAFMAILVGAVLVLNTVKSGGNKTSGASSPESATDDMASHHAPPAPADNSKFQSLLGAPAPEFKLQSFDGKEVNLASLKGKRVVLFFSEGAMCYPGCWDQIDAFVDDAKKFTEKNTEVYTVIVDPKKDWQDAVNQDKKMALANVLLDAGGTVSLAYGMLTVDSSMHRGQFPGHTYIILDKEGVVRYLLDDADMQIRNKELLKELEKVS